MQYAKIRKLDISNGPGNRVSLFTQGCNHKCKGCFNPETWEITGGKTWNDATNEKVLDLLGKEFISGLSILGGDPLCNYEDGIYDMYSIDYLYELLKASKETYPDKSIWLWTGYLWEEIYNDNLPIEDMAFSNRVKKIMEYVDVIVDGKFVEKYKNISLPYCGSENQRVIDVKESLIEDRLVLYSK